MPNINVEVSEETLRLIKDYEKRHGIKNHREYLTHILLSPGDAVWLEFLEINGQEPDKATALILVGECVHRWNGSELELLTVEESRKKLLAHRRWMYGEK